MKRQLLFIIRNPFGSICGYVDTFEEAISICDQKNSECNLENEKKWRYQLVNHFPKEYYNILSNKN